MPRLPAIENNPPFTESRQNEQGASTSKSNTPTPRTPTEHVEALLATIKHPDFTNFLPPPSMGNASQRTRMALASFQNNSVAFNTFAADMRACLQALQDNQFGGPESAQHREKYGRLIEDLELQDPKHGANKYGTQLFQLYSQGCLQFKQLRAMLIQAKNQPKDFPLGALDACRPLVHDLESELLICGDGLLQKLASQTTAIRNTLYPPKISELIENKRVKIAEAIIREQVPPLLNLGLFVEGNEIHIVKTWMDQLKEKLKLKSDDFEDRFANKRAYFDEVPRNERDKILRQISSLTDHTRMIDEIAWDVLDQLQTALNELPDQQRSDFGEVKTCVLEPLTRHLGNISLNALLRMSEVARPELHHEPSLLVAELVDKCKQDGMHLQGDGLEPRTFQLSDDATFVLRQSYNSFWTERKTASHTERALLETEDIDDKKALEVIRMIAAEPDAKARLIAAPFLNDPVHEQHIAPFFNGERHYTSIATSAFLSSIANATEQPRFTKAFEFLIEGYEITPKTVVDTLSTINFSDAQIDTALNRIQRMNLLKLNWPKLREVCLFPSTTDLNPHLYRTLMNNLILESDTFEQLGNSLIMAGNIHNLSLFIETLAESQSARSRFAIAQLNQQGSPDESTISPEMKDFLLSLVLDLNQPIGSYANLLEYCIRKGSDDTAAKIAERWIDAGGTDFQDTRGLNAVCMAAENHLPKTLSILLAHDQFNPTHTSPNNQTALDHALFMACMRPNNHKDTVIPICELLLSKGLSANHENSQLEKTWESAITIDLPEPAGTDLLKLFIRFGASDLEGDSRHNAINIACDYLMPEKLKVLLKHPEQFKRLDFALHKAVCSHNAVMRRGRDEARNELQEREHAIVGLLKPTGADLDREDESGKTPINYALQRNRYGLVHAMLKHAGDINQLDTQGYARIHKAVIAKDHSLTRALLAAGADVNLRSGSQHAGKTALHYAFRNKDAYMQQILIDSGANPSKRDHLLRTPAGYQSRKKSP